MGEDPLNDHDHAATGEERAENGEHLEEGAELFPLGSLEGDTLTAQSYIPRKMPTQVTASLMSAEVPNRGGLLKPDHYGRLLVTYLPGKKEDVPLREERGNPAKVTGYKLRQHLRVTYVEDANDVPALIAQEFEGLLAVDATTAAQLLERLNNVASEALAVPA